MMSGSASTLRCSRLFACALLFWTPPADAAEAPLPRSTDYYYQITPLPVPDDIELEVGGLATLPNGNLGVVTRRGDLYIVENPASEGTEPHFRLFASGLHEALGLAWHNGALYLAQRGELTKLADSDGDGRADVYETVYSWPLSGHYHEYSFGPVFAPDGSMFVTLNVAFGIGNTGWWRGESPVHWRGWALRIGEDGAMQPWATGLRSPAGFGMVDGEFFYSENQGDWVGSGFITHLESGDFAGHPAGLAWSGHPLSPVELTHDALYKLVAPRFPPPNQSPVKPENIEEEPLVTLASAAAVLPDFKLPTVWLPHGILGTSSSQILVDDTGGRFGPYAGQLLVGDQGQSTVNRVFLEKVNGVYQGAGFPFLSGFSSGVLRLAWGNDGSLYVGQTSRGWGSTGGAKFGLERVVWRGDVPFEMKAVRAMPDGFEIEFTKPVARATAANPDNYQITSFIYKYHVVYGSPVVDDRRHRVLGAIVSEDGYRVRLAVENPRRQYVHEMLLTGIRTADDGEPPLNNSAYYTLNEIPAGEPMAIPEPSAAPGTAPAPATAVVSADDPGTGPSSEAGTPGRTTVQPPGWGLPDTVLSLGTLPGLRYDRSEMTVRAGDRVKLIFNNPDDMPHNFLLVAPGAADKVGEAALKLGIHGPGKDYVPDMLEVLQYTRLLEPGQSDTIYFTAPLKPGLYEYVCTYPGHYFAMRGVLRVI